MEAVPGLSAAVAAARAVEAVFSTLTEDQLVVALDEIEQAGRLFDGLRIRAAGEVEHRSDSRFGPGKLAVHRGARNSAELVQFVAKISYPEARRRVALGSALAPVASIRGEELPGAYPAIEDAIRRGSIDRDSARAIVNAMKDIAPRVGGAALDAMEAALVRCAESADTEVVRQAAVEWSLALDPDGVESRDRVRRRKRSLKFGSTLADGTTSATVVLLPEHLQVLQEFLQSRRRSACLVETQAGGPQDPETTGSEWREEVAPDGSTGRSRAQQDYDTLLEGLEAAMRAEDAGVAQTATTHETIITVTAAEVEARRGHGWAPGVMADLPMPLIERRACTDGLRLLVTGPQGEPLHLTHAQRLFTAAQKKALVVRAGGRCQHPGCRVPAASLEAHHIDWWNRNGGPTTMENGIMLCSFHHHLIHAPDSPIRIVRHDGEPWFVPRGWWGPPDPKQRAQTGPPFDGRPHAPA